MDELSDADIFDERLERRFCKLLDSLSKASTASIPAATKDRAEMVAAYRFFDNDNVTFSSVLTPHIESSYRRVQRHKVVLLVQDTTELDVTRPHSQMEGAGPLHNGQNFVATTSNANRRSLLERRIRCWLTTPLPTPTPPSHAPSSPPPQPNHASSNP